MHRAQKDNTTRGRKRTPIDYVIDTAKKMMYEGSKLGKPPITQAELEACYQSAVRSTRPPGDVPITPLMKHMLIEAGVVKDGEKLSSDSPETTVEEWLKTVCTDFIDAHSSLDKYDETLSVFDESHYWVDCRRNIPDNWRHSWIVPKATLEETVAVYRKPFPQVKRDWESVLRSKAGNIAFDYLDHVLPRVVPAKEFKLTAQPFENKDSSTGFPFVRYARSVDPTTGKTYGQLAVELAERTPLDQLWKYNLYIQHARFQRGSQRMVWGSSSVVNSSLNRQARPEIDNYKQSPIFLGYNSAEVMRVGMHEMGMFCEKTGFKCRNNDQKHYDQNQSPGWISFAESLRYYKAVTSLGKEICFNRGKLAMQGFVVTNAGKTVLKVYPRMFSGELDTNSDEGIISAATNMVSLIEQDPDYPVKILYAGRYVIIVIGDDILFIYDPAHYDQGKHVENLDAMGMKVHMEKGEFGLFFLQWRLCRHNGEEIMVRPFTRTLRSLLFKEQPVGLGPYGWLISTWQQFEGLVEFPDVLDFVVSIVYPFDSLQLGVNVTLDFIKEQIRQEDEEAAAKSGAQARTTADRLYDGDPQKESYFLLNQEGRPEINFSSEYLSRIQRALIDSVDRTKPSLEKLVGSYGFPKP